MSLHEQIYHLRSESPDFHDLPWDKPLLAWDGICPRLVDAPHGLSRHPVVFVRYGDTVFALKELPAEVAQKEYEALLEIERIQMPAVTPIGYRYNQIGPDLTGVLITRFLEDSLPYRLLFMRADMNRYRDTLLDALAGLLVQLHLSGVYWGDCSLSNALFRRDAGALQAYLVDGETVEFYPDLFPPDLRHHDLDIMEENVDGDIADIDSASLSSDSIPLSNTGALIRLRYQRLWEEITREDIIMKDEHYRIQERINALNKLGFSVGEVELHPTENGNQLRLRAVVTDRNFHRNQLNQLTGIIAEEKQAQKIMNEIQELKATLSRENQRSTPISVAAEVWQNSIYRPIVDRLKSKTNVSSDTAELYCQVLEHKWFLSEKARHDVGHQAAVEDYLENIISHIK